MNIAILGAGSIAATMATTLQPLKDVTCYAVAARDLKRAQIFADKFGFQKAYGSYKDMLEDPDVELVYIATPHSHHYEHIRMCLNHDKHVLCEKAFTANARQAEEVLKLAESKGLLLTEAIWTRYMPMRQTINEVIKSGIIGKPTSLSANLGYPIEHVERMVKPELCGGALLDLRPVVLQKARRDLLEEAAGRVAVDLIVDGALGRARQEQALPCAGDAHIGQAALFLDAVIVHQAAAGGEDALLHARDEHIGKLKALGAVDGHKGYGWNIIRKLVNVGHK